MIAGSQISCDECARAKAGTTKSAGVEISSSWLCCFHANFHWDWDGVDGMERNAGGLC
jgi:hypothetical protein